MYFSVTYDVACMLFLRFWNVLVQWLWFVGKKYKCSKCLYCFRLLWSHIQIVLGTDSNHVFATQNWHEMKAFFFPKISFNCKFDQTCTVSFAFLDYMIVTLIISYILHVLHHWVQHFLLFFQQVTFNPQDNTQLCVVGNGIFKLYRYSEGTLKQFAFQKLEPLNYTSQAWVSDERVIVGSETGRLLLFESGELKTEFNLAAR